ncbi:MAG TPA: VWA domain-containing protein [Thermoanaerobaculia bacterium]|nr:VWA domain-containing protein [Thermoanaerobaculia bacterium]
MIALGSPIWLLLLALVALRLWIVAIDRNHAFAAFQISSLSLAGRRVGLRSLLAWIPLTLTVLGLSALILAMARPERVRSYSDERRGIDIVIALDASGSMAAEDFRPRNRFIVARDLIAKFIKGRENDRIGIVTFGARAVTRVPITFDRDVAQQVLEKAQIGENGDGTAIGHAIATSVNRLRGSKAHTRVIILLTDGVNNAGSIEPLTAADVAARFGMKIYTIGVGSKGEVPVPVKMQNRLTGEIETVYQTIRADLDEEMLSEVARRTNGSYFRATDADTLQSVFARIDLLEKTNLAAPKSRRIEDLYPRPLATGLALLFTAVLLGETIWFRLPA